MTRRSQQCDNLCTEHSEQRLRVKCQIMQGFEGQGEDFDFDSNDVK